MLRANKLMCLCSRRQHSWLTGPKGPQQCLGTVLWLLFSLGWVGIWMFEWFDLALSGPGTFFWFDLTSSLRFEYLFYPSAPAKHLWHLQYRHHGFAVDMFFIFLVPSIDVICWHNSTPFPVVVPLLLTIRHLRNILGSMRSRKHQAICAQGHLNRFLAHWMFPGPLTSKSVCCMFLTNLWGSKRVFGFQESVDPWQGQRIAWWMGWTNWSSDYSDAGPWWSSCTPFGGEICSLHWRGGWVWWWFGRPRGQNNGLSMNSRFFPHLPGEGC